MKKASNSPATRWVKANEAVAAALNSVQISTGTGTNTRPLPPVMAKRIIKAVKNGTVPASIADLCTLSCALEDHGVRGPDVEAIYQAAHGAWQMRILAAAAGQGS
jgi:hypothetical protein